MCVCVYVVCMYVCIYLSIYIDKGAVFQAFVCVRVYVCMYVCMYLSIYIYIDIDI